MTPGDGLAATFGALQLLSPLRLEPRNSRVIDSVAERDLAPRLIGFSALQRLARLVRRQLARATEQHALGSRVFAGFTGAGNDQVPLELRQLTMHITPGTGDLSGLRGERGFEGRFGKGSDATLDYWFEYPASVAWRALVVRERRL
jgi:hypothetical protein